jgi:hypothetical protein
MHKLFWVALRTFWSGWRKPLVLVTPRTVVNWHRAGFRLYWTWISRVRQIGGRKRVSKEVRALISRMVDENPIWGAPRIHGELLKLGFDVSERSVSRWIRQAPRDPDPVKRWLTFLRNHREAIAAMDFFTVPTLTLGVLYCLFPLLSSIAHASLAGEGLARATIYSAACIGIGGGGAPGRWIAPSIRTPRWLRDGECAVLTCPSAWRFEICRRLAFVFHKHGPANFIPQTSDRRSGH